ncbi:MAG: hypothetical protein HY372_02825 [Candidatus Andersenbacteria bacterium]|nr:hypothetical protein [Candidatus Andersenbacteria bacterium]
MNPVTFIVILFLVIYGGTATYAICCSHRGLAERLDAERKWRAELALQLTKLEGQLAIEGVLPLWGEKFLHDMPSSGVVVDVYGHERRLLSARVEALESRLAALGVPANADDVTAYRQELVEVLALMGRRVDALSNILVSATKQSKSA